MILKVFFVTFHLLLSRESCKTNFSFSSSLIKGVQSADKIDTIEGEKQIFGGDNE